MMEATKRKKRDKKWKLPIIDMTSVMRYGHYWSRICPGNGDNGEGSPKIIGALLTRFFGCCEQERLGVIYPQIMGNGELSIRDLSGGVEKVSGKNCWKS